MTLRVTVQDIETGERAVDTVADGDYILVCAAPCYRAHVTAHANGTHVITVKGRLMRGRIQAPPGVGGEASEPPPTPGVNPTKAEG